MNLIIFLGFRLLDYHCLLPDSMFLGLYFFHIVRDVIYIAHDWLIHQERLLVVWIGTEDFMSLSKELRDEYLRKC